MRLPEEVPTNLNASDKQDALGRIMVASEPFDALLAPVDASELDRGELLHRYRGLVRFIHPERSADPRAADAFAKASGAYDILCAAAAASSTSLDSGTGVGASCIARTRQPLPGEGNWAAVVSQMPTHGRWWQAGNVEALERLLEYEAAALQAFPASLDFASAPRSEMLAALRCCVGAVERECEHLDRSRGLPCNRLWASASGACVSQAVRPSLERLVDLIRHLRAVHRYCPLLRRGFDHPAELAARSPAAAAGQLLLKTLQATCSEQELEHGARAQLQSQHDALDRHVPLELDLTADPEEDPLDVYMAALHKQMAERSSKVARKDVPNAVREPSCASLPGASATPAAGGAAAAAIEAVPVAAAACATAEARCGAKRAPFVQPAGMSVVTHNVVMQPDVSAIPVVATMRAKAASDAVAIGVAAVAIRAATAAVSTSGPMGRRETTTVLPAPKPLLEPVVESERRAASDARRALHDQFGSGPPAEGTCVGSGRAAEGGKSVEETACLQDRLFAGMDSDGSELEEEDK